MRRVILGAGLALLIAASVHLDTPIQAQSSPRGQAFNCVVTTSTATTLQAFAAPCIGVGVADGNALYITDIFFSTSAAGIGADAFPTIKYGTGTTCGTGTTVLWGALTAAAFAVPESFTTPLRVPALNDLCWINSTAGSKFIVVSGYRAP